MKQKGFTLIELLVVIAIIALLASILLVVVNQARNKAYFAKTLSDMKQIATAAELYYSDNNDYPPSNNQAAFVGNYMSAWPTPACGKYIYSFDNEENDPGQNHAVRVWVYYNSGHFPNPFVYLYYYCLTSSGNCSAGSNPSMAFAQNITNTSSNSITCP